MSVEIIEQVTSFSEYMQETSILPKAKNGYWTVSKLKTELFEYHYKYHYEYHIEYKDEKDYEQNFTKYNEDFVSGLKQLGLSEEKISKIPVKIICKKYNDKTPTTFREWRKKQGNYNL